MIDYTQWLAPNPILQPSFGFGSLGGIPVRSDPDFGEWKMKPRPRTRRYSLIRKWLKTRMYFEPNPNIYQAAGVLYGHPTTIAKMAKALELANGRYNLPRDVLHGESQFCKPGVDGVTFGTRIGLP